MEYLAANPDNAGHQGLPGWNSVLAADKNVDEVVRAPEPGCALTHQLPEKNSCIHWRFLLSYRCLFHRGRMKQQPARIRGSAVGVCGCARGFLLTSAERLLSILLLALYPSL